MKKNIKKILLVILVYAISEFQSVQYVNAQSSLHDSLRNMLNFFEKNSTSERLREVVKDVRLSGKRTIIRNGQARKLLNADSLLINDSQQNKDSTLSYTKTLVRALQPLHEGQHYTIYIAGLNNLAQLFVNKSQYEKALPLFQEIQVILKKKLGEENTGYAKNLSNLASVYDDMGKLEKALPLYQHALSIRKRILGEEDPDYAESLNSLAGVYAQMGNHVQSLSLYQQTLAIRKKTLGEVHPGYANTLNGLGTLYMNMGQFGEALPLLMQALEIRKRILREEDADYVVSLNNLASLYTNTGKYEKALPLFEQALAIRKKSVGEQHPDYAMSLNNLGYVYRITGQFDKSLPMYQQALAIREKTLGEKHPVYANSLNNLAELYSSMSWHEKALPLFQQSSLIIKNAFGEVHAEYARSLNNLGVLFLTMGHYKKALPLLQQAVEIQKKTLGEKHPEYAIRLNNLAIYYERVGQYELALPLFQQLLAIQKQNSRDDKPQYANYLNNLAVLYQNIGQYEKAITLYQQALEIIKKALGENHPDYATYLNNLALMHVRLNHYEKSIPLYEQALAINKKALGEKHPNYAASLNNLGELYQTLLQYDKALPLFKQSLTIIKNAYGEAHPEYASYLNNMAVIYESLGEYDKALPLFEETHTIRKKALGNEHPDNAKSLNGLGLLQIKMNNTSEAAKFLIEADTLMLKHLARTYSSLSEHEKMVLLNKESNQFNYIPSLVFTHHKTEPALINQIYTNELALKGMVLENQQHVLNSIRKGGDSASIQLFEQWSLRKGFIGKQLLLPLAKRVAYLDSLQDVTTQMEQQLSRSAGTFDKLRLGSTITNKNIAAKLSKSEAAVEFLRFQLYNNRWTDSIIYAALVILPGDSTTRFIPLFEEKQLRHLLKPSLSVKDKYNRYANIQRMYGWAEMSSSGSMHNSLYQMIWKPLEKYLKNIHTVYLAPAGLLHRISFQALRSNTGHLLIEKYQLKEVLSTGALPPDSVRQPLSVALWGDIEYNLKTVKGTGTGTFSKPPEKGTNPFSFNRYASDTGGSPGKDWNALPGTRLEMDSIRILLTDAGITFTTKTGVNATEESFKSLNGRSPQVLHLATHGFFLPIAEHKENVNSDSRAFTRQQNPMFRSGLVLAGANHAWKGSTALPGREDGILTAYEIAQMDLSNTDLVVLSSCETALGDLEGNEGVIGLQRAFKMAGVKQMIISLWQVPDKQTTELMTLFYRNWLNGQSTREALRSAQQKMNKKYPPYFWAAFVLLE